MDEETSVEENIPEDAPGEEGYSEKVEDLEAGNCKNESDSEDESEPLVASGNDQGAQDVSDDEEEFTEEDLDCVADTAISAIKMILEHFDLDETTIDEYEGDEGEIILDIVGGNLAPLIGRHGKNLDALQLLVSSITYKQLGFRYPVTVDIEGYKNRRREKLESMAESAAARAVRQQTDIKMRPMTAYERRIIHMCLKDDDRVETVSEGTEPNRYVVIRLL